MKVIDPSRIKGTLNAPASKSVMIRAVAAALLAQGTSHLTNPSFCTDSLAALNIASTLGADLQTGQETVSIRGTEGFTKKDFKSATIHCGESGLCMRMFTPLAALTGDRFIVEGAGSLCSRPMKMLEALSLLGGTCETSKGNPPVIIQGPIRGGAITIDASESSQFLTGLLMAMPLCKEDSHIEAVNLKSKPYVAMTIDLLKRFGITIDDDKNLTSFNIRGGAALRGTGLFHRG